MRHGESQLSVQHKAVYPGCHVTSVTASLVTVAQRPEGAFPWESVSALWPEVTEEDALAGRPLSGPEF